VASELLPAPGLVGRIVVQIEGGVGHGVHLYPTYRFTVVSLRFSVLQQIM
jgi:hypothetical protein